MRTLLTRILIPIFFIVAGFHPAVKAESFVFDHDSVKKVGKADTFEFVAYNYVTNKTDEELDLTWERVTNEVPSEWNSAVCDKNFCHDPDTDSENFILEPNESGVLKVHFRPNDKVGNGKVEIQVSETGGGPGSTTHSASFYGESEPGTSSQNQPVATPSLDINFYPNPVDNYLNVDFGKRGNYHVEVVNVLGKEVYRKSYRNESSASIRLSNEPAGVYMLTIKDQNTGARVTKRFSKE